MSVIAKLIIRGLSEFGSGRLVELGCLCDNDLMGAYAETEGDKLFTKFSPWGEMKLHQPTNHCLGVQGDAFYAMIVAKGDVGEDFRGDFPGAYAFSQLRVASITDFGDNQAKRLEMCDGWDRKNQPCKGVDHFNWKMSVDNPSVTSQLAPGTEGYFVVLYPASRFNRDQAIAAAHGLTPPPEA